MPGGGTGGDAEPQGSHGPSLAGPWGQCPVAGMQAGLWLRLAAAEGVQPHCSFLLPRLRSVKMEQRKLSDQANTLVDLSKASPCGDLWLGQAAQVFLFTWKNESGPG